MSHDCHNCGPPSSVTQTLDEMDFERGIWSAALEGDVSRFKKLLDKEATPDQPDKAGYTALHYAARAGHLDVCKALLQAGASVNKETRAGKSTALHRAALTGKEEVVRLLLASNANPLIQDCDGRTALHRSVEANQSGIAKLLIDFCPQITNVADNEGNLPKTDRTI